jgi:hypothetical protein
VSTLNIANEPHLFLMSSHQSHITNKLIPKKTLFYTMDIYDRDSDKQVISNAAAALMIILQAYINL